MGDELCDIREYSAPRRLVASAMEEVYGQRKNKSQPSNNYAICLNGSDSSLGSNIVLVTMASKSNRGSHFFTIRFACQPSFKGDRSYSTLIDSGLNGEVKEEVMEERGYMIVCRTWLGLFTSAVSMIVQVYLRGEKI